MAIVVAMWTLVGLLLATQAWVSGALREEQVVWRHVAAIWLAWAGLWALLTPVALGLATQFPFKRRHYLRAATVHAVSGLVLAALNLAAFAILAPHLGAASVGPTWLETFSRLLRAAFLLNVPVYWLIVGAAHARILTRSAHERERRALQLEAQLADARLLALRAQLQPNFCSTRSIRSPY